MSGLEVEEIRSLVKVGALRAIETLNVLLGQEMHVRGLEVRYLIAGETDSEELHEIKNPVGVFFELKGGIGGFVGFFLSQEMRVQLLAQLLGREWDGVDGVEEAERAEAADSAICEVGNILVSHLASVMADLLGEPMVPSIPHLEVNQVKRNFIERVMHRLGGRDRLWIETDILDPAGDLLGHIVWVPDGALSQSR